MNHINVRRIHHPVSSNDGARFLVDRLWPRGVSKEKAALTAWLRVLSPSDSLRKLYHGEASGSDEMWHAFCLDYAAELDSGGADIEEALSILDGAIAKGPVTLLYAAKDEQRNNAIALRQWIESR